MVSLLQLLNDMNDTHSQAQAYYRGLTGGVIIPSEVQKSCHLDGMFCVGQSWRNVGAFNSEHCNFMENSKEKRWFTEIGASKVVIGWI